MGIPQYTFSGSAISQGERLLATSGLLVVLCILAAGFYSPDPPSHGAPDEAVLAFYQQHFGGVLSGAFLWALGMIALVFFAVALARACERARQSRIGSSETNVAAPLLPAQLMMIFSLFAAMTFTISNAVGGVAAVTAARGAPASTVRALDEISHLISHFGTLPLGTLLVVAGLAQIVSRRGARWIGWLGILSGATLILTASWIAFRQQWLHNAGVVALLAFLLWCVASSASMIRGNYRQQNS